MKGAFLIIACVYFAAANADNTPSTPSFTFPMDASNPLTQILDLMKMARGFSGGSNNADSGVGADANAFINMAAANLVPMLLQNAASTTPGPYDYVQKLCASQSGVDGAVVQKLRRGDFASKDRSARLYAHCVYRMLGLVDETGATLNSAGIAATTHDACRDVKPRRRNRYQGKGGAEEDAADATYALAACHERLHPNQLRVL